MTDRPEQNPRRVAECLSEDLSFVTSQCSVIVRNFALRGELIGPPTASRRNGPSVPWVSLPEPTGVMTHPGW